MTKKSLIVILGFFIMIAAVATVYYVINKKTPPASITPITKIEYLCPDTNKLDYEEKSETYVQWKNCMLHEGVNKPCGADFKYELWVNNNCGIKFKIKTAN